MLDLGAAMARDDYETRRLRMEQGIAKAKAEGKYKGRAPDSRLHESIVELRQVGKSINEIKHLLNTSRSTIKRVLRTLQKEEITHA